MSNNRIKRMPLTIGVNLMIGISAGIGATYFVNRGQLYLLGFIVPIYILILGMTIGADYLIRWMDHSEPDEADGEDKGETPVLQYAS